MGHIQQFNITFTNTIGHSASTKDGTCHLMKMCDWMHACLKDLKRTWQNIVNLWIQSFIRSSYFGCQTWLKLHHLHNLFESQDCESLQNFSSNLLLVDAFANHLLFDLNLDVIYASKLHSICYGMKISSIHPSIHMNMSFETWIIQSCILKMR
jgi:hypothetical protein